MISWATKAGLELAERGFVPDAVIRAGIRALLRQRLSTLPLQDCEERARYLSEFLEHLHQAPIAVLPEKANEQHYEVPAAFFAEVLGPHRKYSSCYWAEGVADLGGAEAEALKQTCERAQLGNGLDILELGCGWGSLTLWMAEHYPESRITAISNSHSQREFILGEADRRRLRNIEVQTCDMNGFEAKGRYDRIVSVEMFEHMRNYRRLFDRIFDWLKPGGRFFMHIFCHREVPYLFIPEDSGDWMSQYFFSGGMMPSDELPLRFQTPLILLDHWRWNGRHYASTANAWLANMDLRRETVKPILAATYGAESVERWWNRWRMFFLACAELFAYHRGQQWWVSHYLFGRPIHPS